MIYSRINEGEAKLPSENSICQKYKVSRQTCRQALDLLIEENLIVRKQGSGTYIHPDLLADTKKSIAILVCESNEYIYPTLIKDIKTNLHKAGYESQIYITDNHASTERKILTSLLNERISGIIAEPVHSSLPTPNADVYEQIHKKRIPILFINGTYSNLPDYPYVRSDDTYGGYLAAKHLIGNNHTNICCILNRDDIKGCDRYLGIASAICDLGPDFNDRRFFWYSADDLSGLRHKRSIGFLSEFLKNHISNCSAIICQSDEIAFYLIKEMGKMGLRVPEDYSVISFDNSYLSDFGAIKLTTLAHSSHELAHTSAQSMIKLIKKHNVASTRLNWTLVCGSSDGYLLHSKS